MAVNKTPTLNSAIRNYVILFFVRAHGKGITKNNPGIFGEQKLEFIQCGCRGF